MVLINGKHTARDLNGKHLWQAQVQKLFGLRNIDARSLHTIAGYRKFVVVRHPMDRFVSAFVDKIQSPVKYDLAFRRRLMSFLNGTYSNATLFQRFAKAVLRGHHQEHWDPIAHRCHFDKVDYDDVIRMEIFRHDLEPMVNDYLKLNWSHVMNGTSNVRRKSSNVSQAVSRTVTSRRLTTFEQLSRSERLQLVNMYRHNFDVLGYDFDVDSLTMSCKIETSDGGICC